MSNSDTSASIPRAPFWLGAFGLIPFLATALLYFFARTSEQQQLALTAFKFYSAVILSFLGGVRWGAALSSPDLRLLLSAVLPSLIAAGCLLLPAADAIPILGLTFLVLGWADGARAAHALWPQWFKLLRRLLSAGVVSIHLIVYAAS